MEEQNVEITESQETVENTPTEVKTFTQNEVNDIVEKRLNRERKKFATVLSGTDPKEAELDERERAVAEKELRIDTRELFRKEGLPLDALELLDYQNKESCDKTIELVRRVFQANVQEQVNCRLRGGPPPKRPPVAETPDLRGAFGLSGHDK